MYSSKNTKFEGHHRYTKTDIQEISYLKFLSPMVFPRTLSSAAEMGIGPY